MSVDECVQFWGDGEATRTDHYSSIHFSNLVLHSRAMSCMQFSECPGFFNSSNNALVIAEIFRSSSKIYHMSDSFTKFQMYWPRPPEME